MRRIAIASHVLLAGTAAVVFSGTASPAWARMPGAKDGAGAGKPAAEKVQTLLVLERSELSKVLVDPKDQRLSRALGMIPARLSELPGEVGAEEPAITAIKTALSTLARPGRIGITVNAGDPSNGLFGYGVVVSAFAADQKDAESLHMSIRGLLQNAHLPPAPAGPKRFESMDDTLAGPAGRLSYGPRHTADGWRYEIILGTMDNPDDAWQNLPKPSVDGIAPVVWGNFNFAGLTPAVNMVAAFAGPQNPQVRQMISEAGKSGLYGPKAMNADFEFGYTPTESRGRIAVHGAGTYKARLNLDSTPLGDAEWCAVPADATMASVSRGDLSMLDTILERVGQEQPQALEGLAQFKAQTGVDLREDILKTLGGTIAYYLSDTTGGGTIGSVVAMISYKDRAKFLEAHGKLMKFANEALAQQPDFGRYVRVQPWTEEGVELLSIRASGVPIPLEITYAPTDKWLIVGLTPQATLAAAKQAMGKGDKGLMTNAMFAAVAKGKSLIAGTFVDTARFAHAGYPLLSMVGSAVSSGVRAPAFATGPARDAGMIVPAFKDLVREMRATVMTTSWSGDTLLIDSHGDRSVLASAAGGLGILVQLSPFISAAAVGAANQHHGDMQGMTPIFDRVPVADAAGWMLRSPMIAPAVLIGGSWAEELGEMEAGVMAMER